MIDNSKCNGCKVRDRDVRVGKSQGFFEDMAFCSACAYERGLVKYGIHIITKHWATEAGDSVPVIGSKEKMEAKAAAMRVEDYPGQNENITYEVMPMDPKDLEKGA